MSKTPPPDRAGATLGPPDLTEESDFSRHVIMGRIRSISLEVSSNNEPLACLLLEELDDLVNPVGNLHLVLYRGEDAREIIRQDFRKLDDIITTLELLRVKAFTVPDSKPARAVGYFQSHGRAPFRLSARRSVPPGQGQ
jgi:hypothetical protein